MMSQKFSSLILFCFFTSQLFAWGNNGHRVVGHIAQQNLNEKAKKQVMEMLQNNSLAEASTWMDDIKSDSLFNHTHDWHWVTVPENSSYEKSEKNPNGDIIAKIEEIITALKEKKGTPEEQQQNLKFLIHLVGDLHQPLHVGAGDDKGGNDVKVTWFGKNSNLHRVWDSDMIEDKSLSYTELANFLDCPSKVQVKLWQSTTVRDWANESISFRAKVYKMPADKKLGYGYSYENFDLVQQRLLQAGIRLAGILNEIYGK